MNKTTVVLAMALLFPASVALGRGDFGRSGGGWGGGDRGASGGGAWSGGDRGGGGWNSGSDNSPGGSWGRAAGTDRPSARVAPAGRASGRASTAGSTGRFFSREGGRLNASARSIVPGQNYRSNGFNRSRLSGMGTAHSPVGAQELRRMGVVNVPRPLSSKAVLPSRLRNASFRLPARGPSGSRLSASVVSPRYMSSPMVVNRMASLSRSPAFSAKITSYNRAETRANHYYWHTWNGYRYCHYYGGYGINWYGWYIGDQCFWTQFYAGNWWWYDDWDNRWCYWDDGNWWWPDPWTTVVYVYRDGNYVPAGSSGSAAAASGERQFNSRDGNLTVKVTPQGDAFLYDAQGSANPVYLDSNVTDVKFSGTGNGTDQVLLILKDGSFEIFNGDGSRTRELQG